MTDRLSPFSIQVEVRTAWIGQVLRQHLGDVSKANTGLIVGTGHGFEIPHVRRFLGTSAEINAYFVPQITPEARLLAHTAHVELQVGDVRQTERVLGDSKNPGLLVCREPRIIESYNSGNGKITYNDWWISTLADYVSRCDRTIITTCFEVEMVLLRKEMERRKIRTEVSENKMAPRNLILKHKGIEGWPDRFVMTTGRV